jgi:phasin family protein
MAEKTVVDMFADMAKQINLPKIDYEAFADIHRKNIEVMQKSAAVVSEGGRAVLAKQQEILAEVGREARQLIADFRPGGSPQEVATKQAELAKRVFEATVRNTRDLAELVQKSNSEAPRIILDRMRDSFAEARAAIESRKV